MLPAPGNLLGGESIYGKEKGGRLFTTVSSRDEYRTPPTSRFIHQRYDYESSSHLQPAKLAAMLAFAWL